MLAKDYFSLPKELPFENFFLPEVAPWEWIPQIRAALESIDFSQSETYEIPSGLKVGERVFFGKDVKLPHFGTIEGPAYIASGCDLRPGVFIRQNVIAGPNCVLGNSCEFKNALLLKNVQAAHFNYVGDSVLGNQAHLGAGVILANLRLDRGEVKVRVGDQRIPSGLKKMGAILGDSVEVACNSVLQPGTVVLPREHLLRTV